MMIKSTKNKIIIIKKNSVRKISKKNHSVYVKWWYENRPSKSKCKILIELSIFE